MAGLLVAVMALAGCSGYIWPSEQACYDIAVRTIKADAALPQDAQLAAIQDCRLMICKSAGTVVVPFESAGTLKGKASYTVWLKRIARTWELDYYYKTPYYDVTNAPSAGQPFQFAPFGVEK